jgi:SAM-dependent methyltransferase
MRAKSGPLTGRPCRLVHSLVNAAGAVDQARRCPQGEYLLFWLIFAIGVSRPWTTALVTTLCFTAGLFSYPAWKPFAKRNAWFVIATNIGADSVRRIGWVSGQIGQAAVLHPPSSGLEQEVARTWGIYRNYLCYAGWKESQIAGKRILELGPGNNIGVPLLFAAQGAAFVAGLDKFVPLQTGSYFREFYSRLRDTLADGEKADFDSAIQLQPLVALRPGRAQHIYGKELPKVVNDLGPGSFDLIASNAVMEEIYDPEPIFQAQDRLLRPGGRMVHKIDLRDYGMFTKYGFPALEFLTVPEWTYRHMAEGSGQPNRRRVNYYRDAARRLGYEYTIYVTHILGVEQELVPPKQTIQRDLDYPDSSLQTIREIRPRLAARFRELSDADLLVQGIVFVARKPKP